jgi:hypothetical protein
MCVIVALPTVHDDLELPGHQQYANGKAMEVAWHLYRFTHALFV